MRGRIISIAVAATLVCTSISISNTKVYGADLGENVAASYVSLSYDNNTPISKPKKKSGRYSVQRATEIPETYNSVAELISDYPSTRDQNPLGTCWAFASISLAEFDMLKKGLVTMEVDYSELQLAYFAYNSVEDPLGGTAGDVNSIVIDDEDSNYFNYGGNQYVATRVLATGTGVVNESDVNYSGYNKVLESGLDTKYAYGNRQALLTGMSMININEQPNEVKKAVMDHGAVGIAYCSSTLFSNRAVYKGEYIYTQYSSVGYAADHAVTIVGWDDNIPKELFSSAYSGTPEGNGGWLIRNSWSTTAENDITSYFWLSYYDATINDTAYVFDFSGADKYKNIYQYDGAYLTYRYPYATDAAQIYTVSAGAEKETLEAVGISFTEDSDVSYTISVYKDITGDDPESGTLVATKSGTTTFAGMYLVELDETIELEKGENFSVVLSQKDGAIDIETSYNADESIPTIYKTVASNSGNSYLKQNGSWFKTADNRKFDGDVCIKVYTNDDNEVTTLPPSDTNDSSDEEEEKESGKDDSVVEDKEATDSGSTDKNPTDTEPTDTGSTDKELSNISTPDNNDETGITKSEAIITASDLVATSSKKEQHLRINAYTNSTSQLSYYTDCSAIDVDSKGNVTIKKNFVGQVTISIWAAESNRFYAANKTIKITVKPYSVKLYSAKNKDKKSVTLKWQKSSHASGYEIMYSTNKKFKNANTVRVSGKNKDSKKITKLAAKKKYFFKLRVYRTVAGKKYYSSWSKALAVKLTK